MDDSTHPNPRKQKQRLAEFRNGILLFRQAQQRNNPSGYERYNSEHQQMLVTSGHDDMLAREVLRTIQTNPTHFKKRHGPTLKAAIRTDARRPTHESKYKPKLPLTPEAQGHQLAMIKATAYAYFGAKTHEPAVAVDLRTKQGERVRLNQPRGVMAGDTVLVSSGKQPPVRLHQAASQKFYNEELVASLVAMQHGRNANQVGATHADLAAAAANDMRLCRTICN